MVKTGMTRAEQVLDVTRGAGPTSRAVEVSEMQRKPPKGSSNRPRSASDNKNASGTSKQTSTAKRSSLQSKKDSKDKKSVFLTTGPKAIQDNCHDAPKRTRTLGCSIEDGFNMFDEEVTMPIGHDFEQFLLDKMNLFTKRTVARCPRIIFREPSEKGTSAEPTEIEDDAAVRFHFLVQNCKSR